jgi:hypothetical protein
MKWDLKKTRNEDEVSTWSLLEEGSSEGIKTRKRVGENIILNELAAGEIY